MKNTGQDEKLRELKLWATILVQAGMKAARSEITQKYRPEIK
jgi:hypothetical protein